MRQPLRSPLGWLHPLSLIHIGSQSQVWAVALEDGAQAALKRLPLAHANPAAAALHARLAHPAIVPLWAHWSDDAHAYQLTPLFESNAHRQPPRPDQAVAWAARLAEGLAALHAHGWAHCDLWPGNVLIDAQGQPIIADLHRAMPFDQQTEPASPLYAAPEVLFHRAPAHPARDVYALGVMLHQWLAGQHPFAHLPAPRAIRCVFEQPLPPAHPRWDALIAVMTHKQPEQRPSVCDALSRLKN